VSPLALICLLSFGINVFMGVFVLLHRRERLLNQTFFLCTAIMAAWSLSVFSLSQPLPAAEALRWVRFYVYAAALAPAVLLHLTFLLFDRNDRGWLISAYAAAGLLAVLNMADLLAPSVRHGSSGEWLPTASSWALLMLAYGAVVSGRAVFLSIDRARNATGIRRGQARYFLLAGVPLLIAALNDFCVGFADTYPGTTVPLVPLFPLASVFWASVTGYGVLRSRLRDLDSFFTRGLVRLFTLLTLAIPFFHLLNRAEVIYYGNSTGRFLALTVVILAAAALAVPPLRSVAHEKLDNIFSSDTRSRRDALLAFSRRSTRILDLDELIESVSETLTSVLGVSAAAVYVADKNGRFRLGGARGATELRLPQALPAFDPMVRWLEDHREAIVREELELESQSIASTVVNAMALMRADVAIALPTPEQLEGIIVLGARDDGAMFSKEDLEVLTMLANQLAVTMSNARLYADLKHSRELIRRSDRLSAIGTMAAGLAHEIRNPLVSIRTFTQLLPERINDEEFRRDFLDLTLSEVDRICALINELLAFARPAPAELSDVDINDSLERLCLLLDTQARNRGVRLRKSFAKDLPIIVADEDQIKQVVMNLVFNALQACSDGGEIEVSSYPSESGGRRFVCVEVRDDGEGIAPEVIENIFDPFFTTRTEGTGLGLSIAHQLAARHGGFLDVRSQPGAGTSFFLNVPIDRPVLDKHRASEPDQAPEALGLHG